MSLELKQEIFRLQSRVLKLEEVNQRLVAAVRAALKHVPDELGYGEDYNECMAALRAAEKL